MLERLWFSLWAFLGALFFGGGVLVAGAATVAQTMKPDGSLLEPALAAAATAVVGPLICRFIYRWGLWVARGSR